MSRAWSSLEHLIAKGEVERTDALDAVAKSFQIRVSPQMQKQLGPERDDPIRMQFIPSEAEQTILERELYDPIGDHRFTPVEGVVHRYSNRALLKVTQLCEVYCRFCFRKEMIGDKGESLSDLELQAAYRYFAQQEGVSEVILTGGDPLILSNRRLEGVLSELSDIEHIKIIRIHTRIPIVAPHRIDESLVALLAALIDKGVTPIVVVHANHSAEFSSESNEALLKLRRAGVMLLSQSVLLKGVNDSLAALQALMEQFLAQGVKPYYLHQMDLARGTSHFVVEQERAIALIRALRASASGIAVPTLIQEIPEGEGKIALF